MGGRPGFVASPGPGQERLQGRVRQQRIRLHGCDDAAVVSAKPP